MVQSIRDVIAASGNFDRQAFEDALGLTEDKVDIVYDAWLAAMSDSFSGALRVREKINANRTYYVDGTNGSDTNDGLTSGAGAFATIQKAVDIALSIDFSIYNVTIQIAAGTYAEAVFISAKHVGTGSLTIQGNSGNFKDVKVGTGASYSFRVKGHGVATFKYMQLDASTGIDAREHCIVTMISLVNNCPTRFLYTKDYAIALCANTGIETIATNTSLAVCYGRSYASFYNCAFTFNSPPTWGGGGAIYVTGNSYVWLQNATFKDMAGATATASGRRFTLIRTSVIDTLGQNYLTFIPGTQDYAIETGSYWF